MKILSLNCQKAYQPGLLSFLERAEKENVYDFILLQEATGKILERLKEGKSYQVLTSYNPDVQQQSQLCILYSSRSVLVESTLISIEDKHPTIVGRPEFGLLIGTFLFQEKEIRVGSLHLHPSLHGSVRRAGLTEFKKNLIKQSTIGSCFIGGDCNFGPRELSKAVKLMSPDFVCVTEKQVLL